MPMNFPDTPTNGAVFTSGASSWTWVTPPGVWKAATAPSGTPLYLPLSGGTLSGALQGTTAAFSGIVTSNQAAPSDGYVGGFMATGNFTTTTGGLAANVYYTNASNWKYLTSGAGAIIANSGAGGWDFYTIPSGTAGAVATITKMANLDINGAFTASGTVATSLGDLYLARTNTAYGYVVRPNVSGYRNLGFCCNGGSVLDNILASTGAFSVTGSLYANVVKCTPNGSTAPGSVGFCQLNVGDASNMGYISWYDTGGTRRGYIGWGNANITLQLENNAMFQLGGNSMFPAANNAVYCAFGGNSWASVSSYAFSNASDVRNKADIRDLPDCLPFVTRLHPQRYRFTNGRDDDRDVTHWGFVAQDVEREIGGGRDFGGHKIDNGEQMIAYHELTAVLWKAVQELAAEVAALKGAQA